MLYFRYVRMVFRCQLQYRASFWMTLLAQMLVPFSVLAGLLMLFHRFKRLGDWSVADVLLCFAAIHMAFALSECFARGFDQFSQLVIQGEFDRILVRPRGTVLQVLGARVEFSRFGRLLLSVLVLGAAIRLADIPWNAMRVLTLFLMVTGGAAIFIGIFMLAAALCFWTLQGLEVANIFTDGGREMAQYPLDIYRTEVMRIFTFIIPFGTVNYLPLRYLLGLSSQTWLAATPLAGFLFLLPCILVWRAGVRHYQSAGS
ncbi:MAG: ABC transporter permease [Clostridiales bacterium]|nr:ABC transporter permease [Clostridiales bacterium]